MGRNFDDYPGPAQKNICRKICNTVYIYISHMKVGHVDIYQLSMSNQLFIFSIRLRTFPTNITFNLDLYLHRWPPKF